MIVSATQKTNNKTTGIRSNICTNRFLAKAWRMLFTRSLVGIAHHSRGNRHSGHTLPYLEAKKHVVKEVGTMSKLKKQNQPIGSSNVRITPDFKDKPNIDKLGRALISVAMKIADKKKSEEQRVSRGGGCHDK